MNKEHIEHPRTMRSYCGRVIKDPPLPRYEVILGLAVRVTFTERCTTCMAIARRPDNMIGDAYAYEEV